MRHFSRPSVFLGMLLTLVLAGAGSATWSVVVVDTATGEIGVAQATCIVGPDLRNRLAVVVPGVGGACVQAWWDDDGRRRRVVWNGFLDGKSPDEILDDLAGLGSYERYQFGIVDLQGRAATHTGNTAGAWAGGRTGSHGNLVWALQGNVLAGENVVLAAEQALIDTEGDLADKLVAAMRAAAQMGGDGRCSCSQGRPDSCGSPVPDFDIDDGDKASHVGFMIVSRFGEDRGGCRRAIGCANGPYHLLSDVTPGQNAPPDPVLEMEEFLEQWREQLLGRTDHLQTSREWSRSSVPANGTSKTELQLELRDWLGDAVPHSGAKVEVRHAPDSARSSRIREVVDHEDGCYTVHLRAGSQVGRDRFKVTVDEGDREVLLYPYPELDLAPTLLADPTSLSAGPGGDVDFQLRGPEQSGWPRDYLLLGSISGTEPGTDVGGLTVPLNLDPFFLWSWTLRNGRYFQRTYGTLDADGHATATFHAPAGALDALAGGVIHFAYCAPDDWTFASNPVGIEVEQ